MDDNTIILTNKFCNAAKNGNLEMVKFLATLPKVRPRAHCNCAVRYASENGHL